MATYKRQRYLFMATDPVHIGTGGYRLGRVDNSIVREPGTRVPKIPGTSLHGAARSYAAQLIESPICAGQGQPKDGREGHCGSNDCPVCYTFGYLKRDKSGDEEQTSAYSGVVNVFDARVLLFPVYSMAGPVWVSTVERLVDAHSTLKKDDEELKQTPANMDNGAALLTWAHTDALNLGWLMVSVAGKVTVTAPTKWQDHPHWKAVQDHVALVHDALFSQVVNSNLEVRTSVAISPERGAAEEGALFTYEALPRTTFLTAEVVLDDYRREGDDWALGKIEKTRNDKPKPLPGGPWTDPLDVVAAGFRMIEWLGVGGMGTRGFGRMAIVGQPLERKHGEEAWR